MTEVAAPAAAPSTPQTTPNGGADPKIPSIHPSRSRTPSTKNSRV